MKVKSEYVSAGVNKVVGALAWGPDNLVAFAAHSVVLIYDVEVRSQQCTGLSVSVSNFAAPVALPPHPLHVTVLACLTCCSCSLLCVLPGEGHVHLLQRNNNWKVM